MTGKRRRVELSAHWISSRSKQTIMNIKASQTITWTRAVNSPAPLATAPAIHPSSPHLHPWISYLACLLLSFSSPLSPSSSLNTRGEGALPLFFLPPLFFLRQATHSITLTTPQNPTSSPLLSQPPFQWMCNPPTPLQPTPFLQPWGTALGLRRG